MGCGFFIFFQTGRNTPYGVGGDGAEDKIFDELPAEVVKETHEVYEKYKAAGLTKDTKTQGGLTYQESLEAIASSITESIEEKHVVAKMEEFKIDEEETLMRFRATITALLEDDELALILIMANI